MLPGPRRACPVPRKGATMSALTRSALTTNGNGHHDREERPVTVPDFLSARSRGRRLTLLTAYGTHNGEGPPLPVPHCPPARSRGRGLPPLPPYDRPRARLLASAGVDAILVGDSLGMVVQGQPDSPPGPLDEMIYHPRLVVR